METDRRQTERKRGYFAVQLDSESRHNRIGVSRDVSTRGMLIATPSRFSVGEEIVLRVYFPDESSEECRGRVLRVEEVPPASDEPWRYRFAVAFEAEQPSLFALSRVNALH